MSPIHVVSAALPAVVLVLIAAGCTQSSTNPPASADDDSGSDGAAGSASEASSGGGSGSGASTSSGSGSGGSSADGGGSSSGGTSSSGSGGSSSSGAGSGSGGGSGSSSGGGSSGSATDGSAASACTKATAVCSADNSGCSVGSYYLFDNQWNCGGSTGNRCGPESAYGCANADGTVSWVVTSNQAAGNTAVLTYPAMQVNFNKPALSSFSTISATFEETSPHVGDYEVAWDCWFNDNANELMIWVDTYNQVPGGSKVASNVSLGSRAYDVYWSPSSGTGGYLAFEAKTTFTSGTVDLLELFNYAVAHGWLPSTSKVDQLDFGVEVCSTNGQDATWTVSNYSLTAH